MPMDINKTQVLSFCNAAPLITGLVVSDGVGLKAMNEQKAA